MSLIDFDSTEFDGFDIELPEFLGDIVSANVNFPNTATQGKAAEFSTDAYTDPTTFVDLEKISSLILDLAELRLDFSPELKALMVEKGLSTEIFSSDLGEAVTGALSTLLETITGANDTDGDGFVPIFQVTTGETGVDSLFHLDTIPNDLSELAETAGDYGFFVGGGASGNFVEVSLDLDQLIATAVNVPLGNSPKTIVNPLDLSVGVADLFDFAGVPANVAEMVTKFLTVNLNVQVADLDVRAGANFSQEFALSVADIDFEIAFEDGTTRTVSANEGGEIVIQNASDLVDTDGDGEIEYTFSMTPDATLFNDTEIGLNVGYTLDFLKTQLDFAAQLPLSELLPGLGLGDISGFAETFSLGPILRLDGDLDVLSADAFEDPFAFDAGTAGIDGSFAAPTPAAVDAGPAPIVIDEEPADPLPVTEPLTIRGTRAADVTETGSGDDTVRARGGADDIRTAGGNDRIQGAKAADTIDAGAGDDRLTGGKGKDVLIGGEGSDSLVFARNSGRDTVADFEVGIDQIEIGRGAKRLSQLDIRQDEADTFISFRSVEVTLENVLVEDLLVADSFSF